MRCLRGSLGEGLVHPLNVHVDIREPVATYDVIMPRVGALDAEALPPGDYELTVEVEDRLSGDIDRVSIPFEKIAAPPRS